MVCVDIKKKKIMAFTDERKTFDRRFLICLDISECVNVCVRGKREHVCVIFKVGSW